MSTESKRLTFVVTPDMEELMDEAKRIFYNKTQSDMIRTLIAYGLKASKKNDKLIARHNTCHNLKF